MQFYPKQHQYYCGIDLHARTMYVCIIDQAGTIQGHRNLQAGPEEFLHLIEPLRADSVVAVACLFTWYWLADLCTVHGLPFVLGHALDMKAMHGGKAKHDQIDAHNIAILLRGRMLPQAYVYPREMRATRDLLCRRMHLVRQRAELLAHVQNTNRQYNLPEIGNKIAYKTNRQGVAERFDQASVRQTITVDLALIAYDDARLNDLELSIVPMAKEHAANTFSRLRSIPGVGTILALVLFYEIHDLTRFPRVQEFASYARWVKCPRESAGKRIGTSGAKIGNVHLQWAFSEAAVLFLRHNPAAQKYCNALQHKHGKAKALAILTHKRGRAVYCMLKRQEAFDMKQFFAC